MRNLAQEAYAAAQIIGHELEFLRLNERFFTHQGKRHYVDFREESPPVELPGTGWFGSIVFERGIEHETGKITRIYH